MQIFYRIINFIVAIQFILLGLICLILPRNGDVRDTTIEILHDSPLFMTILGGGLLVIGLVMLTFIMLYGKKRTYQVRKGRCSITVDEKVFNGYVKEYLDKLFPVGAASHYLIQRKKSLMLYLDIPYIPRPEQESITDKIFDEIALILSEKIGFGDELDLTISFHPPSIEELS